MTLLTETPGWIAALIATLVTLGGGASAGSIGLTNAQVQQAAKAAAESVAQNGCYTSATENAVRAALERAGMDPAMVALSTSATKQGYGQAVDVRMEYVREFRILGRQSPWVWRAAATAPDVSTNVAPIQNAPCKSPVFAAATGRSGLEAANMASSLSLNNGRDLTSLAANAEGCKVPLQRTHTITRYRDETYQEQVGVRQETLYREETYQEAMQKTRTVTKYRDETRYRSETITELVRGVGAGNRGSSFYAGSYNYYGSRGSGQPLVNTGGYGYALEGWFQSCATNRTAWGSTSYSCSDAIDPNYPDTVTVAPGDMVKVLGREWRDYYSYYGRRQTGYSFTLRFGSTELIHPPTYSGTSTSRYYLTRYGGEWTPIQTYSFAVSNYASPGVYYVELTGGWSGLKLPLKIIVNAPTTVTRQVPYTVQVPYEASETYTEMVTKTRQVPYTVDVPVYGQRTRRVPYQEQETYTVYVPCST